MHRCPHVPTAPKIEPLNAISRSQSGITMLALFPPSSRIVLPNLLWTSALTCLPTPVDPVKEMRGTFLSMTRAFPISGPSPHAKVITLLNPCFSRIVDIIFIIAMDVRHVVSAGFQTTKSPQIRAREMFQPATATGKLKAVIIPMIPIGFHYSSIQWSGLSLGITFPEMVRDMPTAMSQMSMNSCTSPCPSDTIFPISREIIAPS